MEADGRLTARLAHELRKEYGEKGFDVFHDHRGDVKEDPKYVGKIVSWFGGGKSPGRETELSQLDIAIVEKSSDHTIALIEIEETSDKPKTLLGDAMAVLVGEEIIFKRQPPLSVGGWTTLIIVARGSDTHGERNDFLQEQIASARSGLRKGNHNIAVVVQGFTSEADLWPKVKAAVEKARDHAASMIS